MGWCGGTAVFDGALDLFLTHVPKEKRQELVKVWFKAVRDGDWDCLDESAYYEEYIKPILLEEDPDWYYEQFLESEYNHERILRESRDNPEPFTDY